MENLYEFLLTYGTNIQTGRMDFASRHDMGQPNPKSGLILRLEGYDPGSGEIMDSAGGLTLRDKENRLAAYWGFDKLVGHWKKKHDKTCFVSYQKHVGTPPSYHYGPLVTLCKGSTLNLFLGALYQSVIYYDPGVNMKLKDERWRAKKRNQFRVRWVDIDKLFSEITEVDLSH